MRRLFTLAIPLALGVSLLRPHVAEAAPCSALPNPIYLQVGDTQNNLMKRLGRALRDNTTKPITLAWITSGSCTNIAAIYTDVAIPVATKMFYIPSIAEDPNWVPSSAALQCDLDAARVPDIANSALFNSACTPDQPPATVKLSQGPVQAYVMAVPEAQVAQTAITYAEAYFVFGFGMGGMISPWDDETQMNVRTNTKSTLLAWAANISVPAAKWKGVRHDGSAMVVSALESSTSEKTIGILGAEVYDARRNTLNILAYRARDQYAAYYPDSTSTALDKRNVRDGHYTVWSPTIWMDKVTGSTPNNLDARYVIDLIVGKSVTPKETFDMTAIVANVGLVPDCAMGVTRDFEGGDLRIYDPTESCVCKYESLVATSACTTCTSTCATGVCRNGFCEVK